MNVHDRPVAHRIAPDHLAPPAPQAKPSSASPVGLALLRITRGPRVGTQFALPVGITSVGRHSDCDIVAHDPTISPRHAVFHHVGDLITVADLGSLTGTYVNRCAADQVTLADRDEIWIGKLRLTLALLDHPMESNRRRPDPPAEGL
jgi:pSer/pThr/pTyr-binding forkhead associated (FHA) protein